MVFSLAPPAQPLVPRRRSLTSFPGLRRFLWHELEEAAYEARLAPFPVARVAQAKRRKAAWAGIEDVDELELALDRALVQTSHDRTFGCGAAASAGVHGSKRSVCCL